MAGGREARPGLGEPQPPRVFLMKSLLSLAEAHRMIILQNESNNPPTSTHPSPRCPPSVSSSLSFCTQLYIPPLPSPPPLDIYLQATGLSRNSTPFGALTGGVGGGTPVTSDDSLSQRWRLINGNLILEMSREEVVFFMSSSIIE